MVFTSDAYKKEQKQDLREKSYVFVNIGIINQNAKDKATVEEGLTEYSNIDSAFRKKNAESIGQYATLEENFTRVDEANAFLPRNSEYYDDTQGLVTATLGSTIRIVFTGLIDVDIKGLTIDFGNAYPTEFTVSNDSVSKTYSKDSSELFTCEDQFDNCTYLEIIPISMVGGNQRLRILSIEFGLGLSFSNEQLISTQRRNSVSHISEALPLKQFDFTVDNLSRKFSQDNPYSFAHYIEEGQAVEYKYGRDIVDSEGNTSIEYIDGGKTYIKTWSSTDLSAKFSTVGRLDMMDSEYFKGSLDLPVTPSDARTAYEVAEEVFQDAGFTANEYVISEYLRQIPMANPMPIATHKACLQMICNATKSILIEDRQGRICIQSSFIPTTTTDHVIDDGIELWNASKSYNTSDLVVDFGCKYVCLVPNDNKQPSEYPTYWELVSKNYDFIFNEAFNQNEATYDWATLEHGFTRVDNTMFFRARSNPTRNPGILTRIGQGKFTVNFEAPWTFSVIEMDFSEILPSIVTIVAARDNTLVNLTVFNKFTEHTRIEGRFENVNKLIFSFIQQSENDLIVDEYGDNLVDENGNDLLSFTGGVNRIHLRHLRFTSNTGHTITNMDLANKPTATSIDKIKGIDINYYTYTHGTETKQLTSVEVTSNTTNIIKMSNPAEWYSVLWETDPALEEWSATKTYSQGSSVKYKGEEFISLVNDNTGNEPVITHGYWGGVAPIDVQITDSGAYFVEVEVGNISGKLQVYGVPMNVNYSTYSLPLHDVGNVKKLNNVLISNADEDTLCSAVDIANWIAEYYSNDTQYTIQYRGEPALDCDDLVYLENQFVQNNLCRIEEEEISTSVGMSLTNSMKLRRVSYTT